MLYKVYLFIQEEIRRRKWTVRKQRRTIALVQASQALLFDNGTKGVNAAFIGTVSAVGLHL